MIYEVFKHKWIKVMFTIGLMERENLSSEKDFRKEAF